MRGKEKKKITTRYNQKSGGVDCVEFYGSFERSELVDFPFGRTLELDHVLRTCSLWVCGHRIRVV